MQFLYILLYENTVKATVKEQNLYSQSMLYNTCSSWYRMGRHRDLYKVIKNPIYKIYVSDATL